VAVEEAAAGPVHDLWAPRRYVAVVRKTLCGACQATEEASWGTMDGTGPVVIDIARRGGAGGVVKVITIRSQIREVAERWAKIYGIHEREIAADPFGYGQGTVAGRVYRDPAKIAIYEKLKVLDVKTATAEDVAAIIGNTSWAKVQTCYECGNHFDSVIELGEEQDYESHTTWVCKDCLTKAVKAMEESCSK
jgi:hypothetical protein